MRRPGRAELVALVAALAVVCVACGSATREDPVASLCEDLLHLRQTVELVARPPLDATVGQVRSALEKLDPTVDEIVRSPLVPEALRGELEDARTAYSGAIANVGDDDPATAVAADIADARQRLGAAYQAIAGDLGCGRPTGP